MQKNFTITHIGDIELSLPMPFIYIPAKGKTFMFQADDGTQFGTQFKGKPISFNIDFWLCAFPTTQEFWEAVLLKTGNNSLSLTPSQFRGKYRPVEQISWYEAQKFNDCLNQLILQKKISFLESIKINGTFHLPTETQWEYAALANDNLLFSGSHDINDVGWYSENSKKVTMPVGLKQPNVFGFFDLSGNVWEWCADSYSSFLDDIPQNGGPNINESDFKVFRGGSCFGAQHYCRTRNRSTIQPELKGEAYGFRILFSEKVKRTHLT